MQIIRLINACVMELGVAFMGLPRLQASRGWVDWLVYETQVISAVAVTLHSIRGGINDKSLW